MLTPKTVTNRFAAMGHDWSRLALCSLMVFATLGCAAGWNQRYQIASAGSVGCASEDIQISNHHHSGDAESWTATCAGVAYVCSSAGVTSDPTCTRRGGSAPPDPARMEARRPQLEVSREGDLLRGLRATFHSLDTTVTLTFAPHLSTDSVALTLAERTRVPLTGCQEFVLTGAASVRAPLRDRVAQLPLRELLAAGQGRSVTARFCGRAWVFTSDDAQVFSRFESQAEEALRNHAASPYDPSSASPAAASNPSTSGATPAPAAAPADATEAVRQRLRERGSVIRACVEREGPFTVEAQWDAAGVVTLRVRGVTDAAVNGCVSDAFGRWTAPASQPGRVLQAIEAP